MTSLQPITDEFEVHDPTSSILVLNAVGEVAALPDGGFAAIYLETDSTGNTGTIWLRQMDSEGNPVSDTRIANVGLSNGVVLDPGVAVLENGEIVVTWTDFFLSSTDLTASVQVRILGENGVFSILEPATLVITEGLVLLPEVIPLSDGGFAVTWTETDLDLAEMDAFVRVYDSDGNALSDATQVNVESGEFNFLSDSFGDSDNGFTLAWALEESFGFGYLRSSYIREFSEDGTATSSPKEIFKNVPETLIYDADTLTDGSVIAVGVSYLYSDTQVVIQKFSPSGKERSDAIVLTAPGGGSLYDPTVSATPDGGFVVTYTDDSGAPFEEHIIAQRYNADLEPVGSETIVNDLGGTSNVYSYSDVDTLENGEIVVVYQDTYDSLARLFAPQWFGSQSDDDFTGTGAAELFDTGAGADVVNAKSGDDTVFGGDGGDTLNGAGGDDSIGGDAGADDIAGGAGNDTLTGDGGKDTLNGNDGDDRIEGGDKNDTLKGGNGKDTLLGGDGDDVLTGGKGKDVLKGDDGNDTLKGQEGADTLHGGAGADVLKGNAGDDAISGQKGNDRLYDEAGNDTLTGGKGDDLFIFQSFVAEKNTITDFQPGEDLIDLSASGATFGDLTIKKTDGGLSTKVILGDFQVVLENVVKSEIGADDFLF